MKSGDSDTISSFGSSAKTLLNQSLCRPEQHCAEWRAAVHDSGEITLVEHLAFAAPVQQRAE